MKGSAQLHIFSFFSVKNLIKQHKNRPSRSDVAGIVTNVKLVLLTKFWICDIIRLQTIKLQGGLPHEADLFFLRTAAVCVILAQ